MARKTTAVKKGPKKAVGFKPSPNQSVPALIFLGLWFFFSSVVIVFPGYSWLLPDHGSFMPFRESWGLAFLLLVGLFFLVRLYLPASDQRSADIPVWVAGPFFLGALALGAWLCSYKMEMPLGGYSQDSSFDLQIRHWRDLHNFRNAFICERGLLPAWPYAACALWTLLPAETGLWIQRLTGVFFDLGTIVVLYLAAKELGGRRMAVIAAVLTALSKPVLSRVVSGYASSSLVFGIGLALWLSLRLNRKNSVVDFLWWALGIGVLAYTSAPVEPFIPFFVFGTLGMLYWNNRETLDIKKVPVFIWVSLALLLPYFLSCLNAFPSSLAILRQIKAMSNILGIIVVIVCGFVGFGLLPGSKKRDLWSRWFLGAWFTVILTFPSMTNDFIIGRIVDHSLVSGVGFLSPIYLWTSFRRLPDTLQWLFWICVDRPDMGMPGDPLFSYIETIFIGLGVVFCLARFNVVRLFLLFTVVLGILPHFFADSTHSGLLIGCVPPFLLIGALGLNELLDLLFRSISKPFWARSLVYLLLIVLAAWSAQAVFSRIYPQWAERPAGMVLPRAEIFQKFADGHRVYISKQMFDSSAVLYEGMEVHLWHSYNVVTLAKDEKAPDVDIYISAPEGDIRKGIIKDFPNATWKAITYPSQPDSPEFWHCIIPGTMLEKARKGALYVNRLNQTDLWQRTYMAADGALNLSMVNWDDKAADIYAPLPDESHVVLGDETVNIHGQIQVTQGGEYDLSCHSANRAIVFIDNVKVFDMTFPKIFDYEAGPKTDKTHLKLTPGVHQVHVIVSFQNDSKYPDVIFHRAGSTGEGQSLWKSFIFD